jgi:hypothetical protein
MRDRTASLRLAAGLTLVAVVPLAPGASAQAAPAIDPCELLTRADIEAVTGEKVDHAPRPRRTDYGTMQTFVCTHRTPGWTVALHVERGRTADEVEGYLRTLGAVVKQATVSSTLTPVPGLGDRAWWGPVNPTNGILHVVKGTDIVWLQTHGKGIGAGTLDKTKLLMQATLSRYAPGP